MSNRTQQPRTSVDEIRRQHQVQQHQKQQRLFAQVQLQQQAAVEQNQPNTLTFQPPAQPALVTQNMTAAGSPKKAPNANVTDSPSTPRPAPTISSAPTTSQQQMFVPNKYSTLMSLVEEMGKDLRPSCIGNKLSQDRFRRGIHMSRMMVKEMITHIDRQLDPASGAAANVSGQHGGTTGSTDVLTFDARK